MLPRRDRKKSGYGTRLRDDAHVYAYVSDSVAVVTVVEAKLIYSLGLPVNACTREGQWIC